MTREVDNTRILARPNKFRIVPATVRVNTLHTANQKCERILQYFYCLINNVHARHLVDQRNDV